MDKIQLTNKEFKELYEITEETEDTARSPTKEPMPVEQDTTHIPFLTEEEQEHDRILEESLGWEEPTE